MVNQMKTSKSTTTIFVIKGLVTNYGEGGGHEVFKTLLKTALLCWL